MCYTLGYSNFKLEAKILVYMFFDALRAFKKIESSIHTKFNKPAPKYFDRYGQKLSYLVFKRKSKQRDISYEVSLCVYCIFWYYCNKTIYNKIVYPCYLK